MQFSFLFGAKEPPPKSSFVVLIIKPGEKVENKAEIILHKLYRINCPTHDL